MTPRFCPHCGGNLGSLLGPEKGEEIDSGSGSLPSDPQSVGDLSRSDRARVRGKSLAYSSAFETAWKTYGRKEEKLRAYKQWVISAKESGGESRLLPLILGALSWQAPLWSPEGWKFAPYFERYLKRRKWEDEKPAPASAAPATRSPWRPRETWQQEQARVERERQQAERDRVKRAEEQAQRLINGLAEAKS